jgi:hypothetical protein
MTAQSPKKAIKIPGRGKRVPDMQTTGSLIKVKNVAALRSHDAAQILDLVKAGSRMKPPKNVVVYTRHGTDMGRIASGDDEPEPSWLDRKIIEWAAWWDARHPLPPVPGTPVSRKWVRDRYQETIWPLLERHGFDTFHDRCAWRHREQRLDVVELHFYPKSEVRMWGLTPCSFAVEVGVFYPFIPPMSPLRARSKHGEPLPDAFDCHLRHDGIERQLPQKRLARYQGFEYVDPENRIPNIWYVAPDGSNLGEVMADVSRPLAEQVLPWLARLDDLPRVTRYLIERKPEPEQEGLAALGSRFSRWAARLLQQGCRLLAGRRHPEPAAAEGEEDLEIRWDVSGYVPGFLALELGWFAEAAELLQEVADAGHFTAASYGEYSRATAETIAHGAYLEAQIRAAIDRARAELARSQPAVPGTSA